MAAPQHFRSDVVRSGAISDGLGAWIEDLVCLRCTETSRRWSSYAESFDRQLLTQRGGASRLLVTLVLASRGIIGRLLNVNHVLGFSDRYASLGKSNCLSLSQAAAGYGVYGMKPHSFSATHHF